MLCESEWVNEWVCLWRASTQTKGEWSGWQPTHTHTNIYVHNIFDYFSSLRCQSMWCVTFVATFIQSKLFHINHHYLCQNTTMYRHRKIPRTFHGIHIHFYAMYLYFFFFSFFVVIFIFNQLEVFMCSLLYFFFFAINIFGCVTIEMASLVVVSHFDDTVAAALFFAYVIPRKTTKCHHIYIESINRIYIRCSTKIKS